MDIVIAFDTDAAGKKAALRAHLKFLDYCEEEQLLRAWGGVPYTPTEDTKEEWDTHTFWRDEYLYFIHSRTTNEERMEVFESKATQIRKIKWRLKEISAEWVTLKNKSRSEDWGWELAAEKLEEERVLLSRRLAGLTLAPNKGYTKAQVAQARAIRIEHLFPVDPKYIRKYSAFSVRCPFREGHKDGGDSTPSFNIYPDNHYHCFGCGEHGDSIDLVKKLYNKKFSEAVAYLLGK